MLILQCTKILFKEFTIHWFTSFWAFENINCFVENERLSLSTFFFLSLSNFNIAIKSIYYLSAFIVYTFNYRYEWGIKMSEYLIKSDTNIS